MRSLTDVLQVHSQRSESIYSVVGRMQLLLDYCTGKTALRGFIPFLYTYYTVSKTVAQQGIVQPKYYHNPAALQELDVYFAQLYFKPFERFVTGATDKLTPWQSYFSYCQSGHGNAFLEMLLGINAHINADLPVSLFKLQYSEQADFNKINHILELSTPPVMAYLTVHYRNLIALGGLVLPQLTNDEFRKIVVVWRHQAWRNARKMTAKSFVQQRRQLHQQTERVAHELIDIFHSPETLLRRRKDLNRLRVTL